MYVAYIALTRDLFVVITGISNKNAE